jgi:chorismate synthase
MALSEADIQPELDRRRPGTSRHVTQRNEPDAVEILSGVYEGKTTGTPICLLIRNTDQRSKDYGNIVQSFRPGHADYTYWHKYGIRDPRRRPQLGPPDGAHGGRRRRGPQVAGRTLRHCHPGLHDGHRRHRDPARRLEPGGQNPFFAATASKTDELEAYMDALRKAGDSVGALYVEASGLPVGWGAPLFDKLDADIAYAMMGINAVKGVEIGAGFDAVRQRGSEHGDELTPEGFVGNHAGGVLGGISTGQDITVNIAIKPTSSIRIPRRSIDLQGQPAQVETSAATTPASASAPRPSPKPCWPWC